MSASKGKASEEYLILLSYIKGKSDGERLDYQQIKAQTGVNMDSSGKAKLRLVTRALSRRYDVIPGVGIILDSPGNTGKISDTSVMRIGNAIHRSRKTHDVLARHLPKLPFESRETFRFRQTVLLTIDTEIERAALTHGSKQKQLPPKSLIIPLPNIDI